MTHKPHQSPSRVLMKLLCKLLALVFLILLGATALFHHFFGTINYTGTGQIPFLSQTSVDDLFAGLTGASAEDPVIGGTGSGLVNILLIGQDRREGESGSRSDSMILCTVHKQSKTVTMTSFLRDLYVAIPGHGSNRINAAYSYGGMQLLEQTIEENFGVHIDGSVEVDFSQFSTIVDLLGGVELELRQDEADFINEETGSAISDGVQWLDGAQTLAYSRIRKLDADGDFSRTNRQRKVLSALLASGRQQGLTKLFPILQQILPMISTDLNNAQLLMLSLELLPALSDLELTSQHIPAPGAYTDQTIDGMAVLVPDLPAARTLLQQTLLPD